MSIGTPIDPPPDGRRTRLVDVGERAWLPVEPGIGRLAPGHRRLDRAGGSTVAVEASQVAACVGTKEFVGTLPQWLRLRRPDRDTVLYPEIAYPTYEMGAILAGCRPVAVPLVA